MSKLRILAQDVLPWLQEQMRERFHDDIVLRFLCDETGTVRIIRVEEQVPDQGDLFVATEPGERVTFEYSNCTSFVDAIEADTYPVLGWTCTWDDHTVGPMSSKIMTGALFLSLANTIRREFIASHEFAMYRYVPEPLRLQVLEYADQLKGKGNASSKEGLDQ